MLIMNYALHWTQSFPKFGFLLRDSIAPTLALGGGETPVSSGSLPLTFLSLSFYAVLGFEPRTYTLSHSTSPFL
jgi:hypothetical protein